MPPLGEFPLGIDTFESGDFVGVMSNPEPKEPAAPLPELLEAIRGCRLCEAHLPHEPRPVLRAGESARILIVGQAPGAKVHDTGIPWNDASGNRLRAWLAMDRDTFYDTSRIAILPMGFCYPGRNPRGGDLPPRPECGVAWHGALWEALPRIETVILAGHYAQRHYLGPRAAKNVTETVRAWREYAPGYWPLPHPSFRNLAWLKRNPWFEAEAVPELREYIHGLLAET